MEHITSFTKTLDKLIIDTHSWYIITLLPITFPYQKRNKKIIIIFIIALISI